MRKLFLVASFLVAPLVSAQELHTFSNGEVADAEKINENFQYVLENATGSGGCSAEQDGSSVVLTCADGTSGVLVSAGAIVIGLPEGEQGEIIEAFNTGAIIVKDANDTLLGEYSGGYSNTWEMVIDRPSTDDVGVRIAIDNDKKKLFGDVAMDIFFESPNCEGASFSQSNVPAGGLNGSLYLGEQLDGSDWEKWFVFTDQKFTTKLVQSRLLRKECHELSSYVMQNAVLVMPYILPAELLQMAFPLSLEQLP